MSGDELVQNVERELALPAVHATIEALSSEQRELLLGYWIDRARGELTTALTFEFMADDLFVEAAPETLTKMARKAVADEHQHFECCLRWARFLDPDREIHPELSGTRPLELDGASAHDNRLLRTVFGCCFSETIAVHVLRESDRAITFAGVRSLNRGHLRDELQHARLGWALVGWPGLTARDRDMIRAYVPELTRLARRVWLSTPRPNDEPLLALGYLSSSLLERACNEAMDSVILPGLAELA